MRFTLALFGFAACAAAQAVTSLISPTAAPPAGCTLSRTTPFELSIATAGGGPAAPAASFGKRANQLVSRQDGNGQLLLTLNNGVLKDSNGRQGYVASNFQFQFDGPPQAGAIYTAGFSICANDTIALGGSAIWWSCTSGSSFDNLYDRAWAPYCKPVYFEAIATGAGSGSAGSVASSTTPPTTTPSSQTTAVGTSSTNATTTTGNGTTSASAAATSSSPGSSSAASSSTGSSSAGSSSATGAGTGTGTGTGTATSTGAAAILATEAPQALLSWAVGVVGVLALL